MAMYKQRNGEKIKLTAEEEKAVLDSRKPNKEKQRQIFKQKLHEDMSKTTVEINGKVFWADPGSEQNFSGRIREMELSGKTTTKWAQGLDVFSATLDELKFVVAEGTKKNAALWDAYILEVESL